MSTAIDIDRQRIAAFCRKWRITELSLFGSVVREDFSPGSDVDVLIDFAPAVRWTLLDLAQMQAELEEVFGRGVDLVTRRGVEGARNQLRSRNILSTVERVYAA